MFSLFGLFSSKAQTPKSIHSFKVESLDGKTIDFSKFKGKKILIVNTASECGFTPQYEDLEKLYETYKDKLVIVGFPANNFGGQEPGTTKKLVLFAKKLWCNFSNGS
jgi:glutathione peroxidase